MYAYRKAIFQNREHAAQLLAEKLTAFRSHDEAIVVAVPRGGVPVGYELAQRLGLPLEVMPCKKISDPTTHSRSIGSVSIDDAVVNEGSRNIPQDFIYRKIISLQHNLKSRYGFYSDHREPVSLRNKKVILTDDLLRSGDTIMACLKSIKKQNPEKIVVAIPVVSVECIEPIRQVADEFIFLFKDAANCPSPDIYDDFPEVQDEEVRHLFGQSRGVVV